MSKETTSENILPKLIDMVDEFSEYIPSGVKYVPLRDAIRNLVIIATEEQEKLAEAACTLNRMNRFTEMFRLYRIGQPNESATLPLAITVSPEDLRALKVLIEFTLPQPENE